MEFQFPADEWVRLPEEQIPEELRQQVDQRLPEELVVFVCKPEETQRTREELLELMMDVSTTTLRYSALYRLSRHPVWSSRQLEGGEKRKEQTGRDLRCLQAECGA